MRHGVTWGMALGLLAALAAPAAAQEKGDVGLTMGYPAAIGVVWHIADWVAIRPDVAMTWTSTETESTIDTGLPGVPSITSTTSADLFNTSVGLSALFYVHTEDRFRLYVVPRGAYLHTSLDLDEGSGLTIGLDESSDGFLVSGALGAQVKAHERFSIFGELGLQYTSQGSETSRPQFRNENESHSFGLRSAVGVTLYF